MVVIMWARVCIILHNLIIRIEGDNFDEEWREELGRAGLRGNDAGSDADDDDRQPEDPLEHAQRQLETPGQRFRYKLMEDLFNSPSLMIGRRP
jgi:hypothetical protein